MNTPTNSGERFAHTLQATSRGWRVALDRRLKDLGMSEAAWISIACIAKAEQPLSQSELAGLVSVEPATMVAMIDRLVRDGLVERRLSETDRRVKRVIITDAGKKIYQRVRKEADAFRFEILSQIDPKKLNDATLLLEEIQNLIE